ncbi:PREDICTED: centrosomal protein of 72 kDa isoform X2 [Chinchilla lanigera]|uniref:centrosomal protein of 72 kDa isoform X2 n=1 Tax=Chinchilla lanigera TaxID=34839 RepID=UPI00038ED03D|nr:PREDICTED: centrosomal protein of 72 kDa isoform X2 [Chinchilla lanigera]
MAPGSRLLLSEETVRERSGLGPQRDLAELQSLSIPGTYQEKITHLGSSLMHLTGLKSLDLSRNSLVSLEGIQYLVSLESLNLYYNCISSLAEVFRLHVLTELQDVDLRLNPVVKNEPDYRLFVLHMLPRLRQLDDRLVRESERKASRLHFALEDSLDSKESLPAALKVGRPHRSRVRCAETSAKKCLVMDADDEAVLNLIAECEWDLSNPPGSTSSSQEQEATFHRTQESRHLLSPPSVQHQCGDPLRKGHDKRRASSSTCCPEQPPPHQHCGELSPQHGKPEACCAHSPHIDVITHPDSTDIEDSSSSCQKPSLSSQKVLNPLPVPERYRKRRMHGGRFQMLSNQKCLSHLERASGLHSLTESLSKQDSSGGPSQRAFSLPRASEAEEQTSHSPSISHLTAPLGERAALDMVFLEALLNLVDKYWSGCRSLHGNQAFLAQAKHVLSSVQELASAQGSTAPGDEEVSYLVLENQSLHMRLAEQQQQYTTTMSEVTAELSSTQREMDLEGLPTQDSATLRALPNCYTPRPQDTLRQHLDRSLEENNSLKSMLFNMKKEVKNGETSAALNVQISGLQLPGQHQRAPPAGAEPGKGTAQGRGGTDALELPGAQEDCSPVPASQRQLWGLPVVLILLKAMHLLLPLA